MSAAQNRFKQARAPFGGSEDTQWRAWGALCPAQNRFKQARAPSGGSVATQWQAWGVL